MNNTSMSSFCNTDLHLNAENLSAESSPNSVDDGQQIECDVVQVVQHLLQHVEDEFPLNGGNSSNKFDVWKFRSRTSSGDSNTSDSTASYSSAKSADDDSSSISQISVHHSAEFSDSSDVSDDSESNLVRVMKSSVAVSRYKYNGNLKAPKVHGELSPEELPKIERLSIKAYNNVELVELGEIKSVFEKMIIINSNENVPPLAENTVVFNDSRKSVGEIFEVFGPVKRPMYIIRYNGKSEIEELNLKEKMKLYYVDDEAFTNKIIPHDLIAKGSDASWMHNHEVPEDERDFSDDEQERKWKLSMRTNCTRNRQCGKSEASMLNAEDVSNCTRKRQRNNQRRNNFKFAEGVQAVATPLDNFAQNGQRTQLYRPRNYFNPRYSGIRYPARMDNLMIAGGSRFAGASQHRFPSMVTMPALRCNRFVSTRMPGNVLSQQNGNHGFAGFGTRNPYSNPFRNTRPRFHR
ncbi:H/ACA ribonucleoprotein complex non-core subunit NAF1 [Trichinella zimbabwensis]|uniref:H/ACA ribonucleoprotein complex non-core subunit NAF1 n=1 Tax=Trichinella zimbabwensis TaxID=268475 RepID=A0A0V1I422_9BILA|nr:H/ACA ribonucleoprotein complex non-core subunit NAF1 [Trichinella zimbabwensis]